MLVDDLTEQKKKLIERKYPELENLQKPKENIDFSMVAITKHCKTQCF